MTTKEDKDATNGPSKEGAQPKRASGRSGSSSRRNLLKVGLTMGIVFVAGGLASATKSLFSPENPPSPQAVPTTTPTVTKTKTVTSTATVTQGGPGGNSTSTSSQQSSASSSTSTSTTSTSSSPFPRVLVANVSDLKAVTPIPFNYPLEETPNILVKLGVKAKGGVGPDGDIVAFSQVCQHLGCIYAFLAPGASPGCDPSFKAAIPQGYCCCHGGQYDLTDGAKVIGGPPPRSVPQVTLQVDDSGNIFAIGMGPPSIFGHVTGSSDVLNDLEGGTLVSGQ
jgi:arsenite oxidase small subunit